MKELREGKYERTGGRVKRNERKIKALREAAEKTGQMRSKWVCERVYFV